MEIHLLQLAHQIHRFGTKNKRMPFGDTLLDILNQMTRYFF